MAKLKIDKRLLGTWQSDRHRTIQGLKWRRNSTAAGRKKFAALFGRLVVRYTRTKIRSGFEDEAPDSQPYEVLTSDSDSVAILSYVDWRKEMRIQYIRFDGNDYYWTIDPIGTKEWFRRISPASSRSAAGY